MELTVSRDIETRVNDVLEGIAGHALIRAEELPDELHRNVPDALLQVTLRWGVPVSQNSDNEFLCRVEDKGEATGGQRQRGYRTRESLPFHSDRCDYVVLYCRENASAGGETKVVDMMALYDALRTRFPAELTALSRPYPFDRRGEQLPGEHEWTEVPILSRMNDFVSFWYCRRFIDSCTRFLDFHGLSKEAEAALEVFDDLVESGEFTQGYRLGAGDLLIMNSHRTLHGRDAYVDDGTGRRLLYRIWLAADKSPALSPHFRELFGRTEAGAYRGGVWSSSLNLAHFPGRVEDARARFLTLESPR